MKKSKTELLIIVILSVLGALIVPNYLKERDTIAIKDISEFSIYFIIIFIVLAVLYFSNKPKEKTIQITDGYQTLYNENNLITKEGVFKNGKLIKGTKYIYNTAGQLLSTEKYENGICIEKKTPL